MTHQERPKAAVHYLDEAPQLAIVQLTIAICKEEVESIMGKEVEVWGSGSPWARAFTRTIKELRDSKPAKPKPTRIPG